MWYVGMNNYNKPVWDLGFYMTFFSFSFSLDVVTHFLHNLPILNAFKANSFGVFLIFFIF